MNQRFATTLMAAALMLSVASAHAGPCSKAIARFEKAVRQAGPGAGPAGRQSVAAQLHRQPTPGSVRRAEARVQAGFDAALARAKRLDARGNRAGCRRALAAAKDRFDVE